MSSSKNLLSTLIIGILTNIISFYLLQLQIINAQYFITIIAGSIILTSIIAIQINYSELKKEVENQKVLIEKLKEKINIRDTLIKHEFEIQSLKEELKNVKRK